MSVSQHSVCLVSLGCPKNLVDAEVMLGHLPTDRYQIVTDEAVHIGAAPPAESYLRGDAIIAAARATGAQAIHPSYNFV